MLMLLGEERILRRKDLEVSLEQIYCSNGTSIESVYAVQHSLSVV